MMKSLFRPSLSERLPKYSAPTTSPARYTVASRPACVELRPSVSSLVSSATTPLATVISSPSRIQATPRATTIRVWNGDHGSRSIRAGMRLRMAPGEGADASWVVVIERLRAWLTGGELPLPSSLSLPDSTVPSARFSAVPELPALVTRSASAGRPERGLVLRQVPGRPPREGHHRGRRIETDGPGHARDHAPARSTGAAEQGAHHRPRPPHLAVRDDDRRRGAGRRGGRRRADRRGPPDRPRRLLRAALPRLRRGVRRLGVGSCADPAARRPRAAAPGRAARAGRPRRGDGEPI